MSETEALIQAIYALCEKKGISVNKLASLSGLRQSTIDSILKGKSKNPRFATVQKLADGFGIPVEEFMYYIDSFNKPNTPLQDVLPARLQKRRTDRGLSYQEMANALGLDEWTYRYYEDGIFQMRLPLLIKIAEILDTSLDYLVGLSDDPERH